MKPRDSWVLIKQAAVAWSDDGAPTHGAAIAYYAVFSLSPLLLVAINTASLVVGAEAARSGIVSEMEKTLGPTASDALTATLDNAYQTSGNAGFTAFGLVLLLVGASGVFVQLQDTLNIIWKVKAPTRTRNIVVHLLQNRLLSFAAVVSTGFLLLVSLLVSAVLAGLSQWLTSFPGSLLLWQGLALLVSFGFVTLLFALIFRLLPDATIAWGDVWLGALITAMLFSLGQQLIGLYLGHASPGSTYGAAGSLVVLLIWVYYSAQIILFGAELTRAYAHMHGSHRQVRG